MYTTDVFTRVYAREKVCVDFFFLLSRCFLTFFFSPSSFSSLLKSPLCTASSTSLQVLCSFFFLDCSTIFCVATPGVGIVTAPANCLELLLVRARMAIDTPFVYQKSNKKRLPRDGADICEIKCKALACNIQKCIASLPNFKSRVSSSSVDFELCRNVIDRYDKCCETWREREKRGET